LLTDVKWHSNDQVGREAEPVISLPPFPFAIIDQAARIKCATSALSRNQFLVRETVQSKAKRARSMRKTTGNGTCAGADWLPHKVHFRVHRRLPPLEKLISRADSACSPLCGSPLRVVAADSEGTLPRTRVNPRGTVTIQTKMTTIPSEVTCKRCIALMKRFARTRP
jgi:hypothetical protein